MEDYDIRGAWKDGQLILRNWHYITINWLRVIFGLYDLMTIHVKRGKEENSEIQIDENIEWGHAVGSESDL